MALTQTQLDERRAWMGATDVARVMTGRGQDVLLEKVFGTVAQELSGNDQRTIGDDLEPVVVNWAERQLGPLQRHPDWPVITHYGFPLKPSPDAMVIGTGAPVEAKTSGIKSTWMAGEWGDEGTDEVPTYYIWQCTAHIMGKLAVSYAHLPALVAGFGYRMYHIKQCDDLIDQIAAKCSPFWRIVQEKGVLDDTWGNAPSIDTCRALARVPGKVVELPERAVNCANMFEEARTLRLDIEKGEEAAKALLLAALGDAERGVLPDGRIVERKVTKRKKYTVEECEVTRLEVRKPTRKELE